MVLKWMPFEFGLVLSDNGGQVSSGYWICDKSLGKWQVVYQLGATIQEFSTLPEAKSFAEALYLLSL